MLPEPDTHTRVPRYLVNAAPVVVAHCRHLSSSSTRRSGGQKPRAVAKTQGDRLNMLVKPRGDLTKSACTAGWTLLAPSMCSPVRAAKTIMSLNLSSLGWCLNHDFIFPLSALLGKIWGSQFSVVVSRRTGRRYWDLLECGPADSLDAACTEWRIQNTVMAFAASEKC